MGKALVRVSDDTKARDLAIQQMNEELRKEFEDIAEETQDQAQRNVKFYHKLGLRAAKIHADTQTYGEGAIEKLSAALVTDRSILYKAMAFVARVTGERLAELMERKTSGDNYITWSHFAQLVHVEDQKLFDSAIEEIFEKDLSIRDLRDLLKTKKYTGGGSGRQPVPRTLMGGMSQMVTMAAKLNQKFASEFDDIVFDPLAQIENEAITEDMIKRVAEGEEVLTALGEQVTAKAKELEEIRGKLVKGQAAALKDAEKAAAAEAKEAEKAAKAAAKEPAKGKGKEKEKAGKKPGKKQEPAKKRARRPVEA